LSFSDATWVALSHPAMSTIMVGVVAPLDALDAQHIELALDSRRRCGTSAPSSIIRASSQDALYGNPG